MPEPKSGLRERWAALRSGSRTADMGVPTLEVGVATSAGVIRLAVGDGDRPRLLIPVDPAGPLRELPHAQGLEVGESRYSVAGRTTRFLDLAPTEPSLLEVFLNLAQELLRRIDRGQAPLDGLDKVICEYRELLRTSPRSPISRERALGLFGELLMVDRLVGRHPAAWKCWHGAAGARHDFRRGDLALEAKVSLRGSSQVPTIEISALDQLEPPEEAGRLFLAFWQVEEDAKGRSVSDIAEGLIERIADPHFAERLERAGYRREQQEHWAIYRFAATEPHFFRVEGDFPRLTRSQVCGGRLPTGVSHLRYRVDLSQAEDYRLDQAASEAVLGELAAP